MIICTAISGAGKMNELRLSISKKLEDDFHVQQLSECKTEEAVKIENIRYMMKLGIIEAKEKADYEEMQVWELRR